MCRDTQQRGLGLAQPCSQVLIGRTVGQEPFQRQWGGEERIPILSWDFHGKAKPGPTLASPIISFVDTPRSPEWSECVPPFIPGLDFLTWDGMGFVTV